MNQSKWKYCCGIITVCLCLLAQSWQMAAASEAIDYHSQISPILSKYCITCHNDKDMKADFSYQGLSLKDFLADGQMLEDMQWVIEEHEMPPAKAKLKLPDADRTLLARWIETQILTVRNMSPDDPGLVTMSRLTSSSYDRALKNISGHDLVVGKKILPNDGAAGEGFTNVGSAQGLPPSQLESYLEAARSALEYLRLDPISGAQWSATKVGTFEGPAKRRMELAWEYMKLHNDTYDAALNKTKNTAGKAYKINRWKGPSAAFVAYLHATWRYRHRTSFNHADMEAVVTGLKSDWKIELSPIIAQRFVNLLAVQPKWIYGQKFLDEINALPGPDALKEKEAVEKIKGLLTAYGPYLNQKTISNPGRYGLEFRPKRYEDYNKVRSLVARKGIWPMNCDVSKHAGKDIWLVVTDATDGNEDDIVYWQDGELTFTDGSKKPWATAGIGISKQDGTALKPDADGRLRVQAPAVIRLKLPAKVTSFRIAAAVDRSLKNTSVQAVVLGAEPSQALQEFIPSRTVMGAREYELPAGQVNAAATRLLPWFARWDGGGNLRKNLATPWPYLQDHPKLEDLQDKRWGPKRGIGKHEAFGANPSWPWNPSVADIVAMMNEQELAQKELILKQLNITLIAKHQDLAAAQKIIKTFAQKAWSRPITDTELAPLSKLYKKLCEQGIAFDAACKEALVVILIAPQFLYQ
ncbi:MAG: DUF1595 domain-containing protein, partial [Planctomycetes bacterium]|nr:DUF1595 domain-containing protein [Planctomycetota bacterium]